MRSKLQRRLVTPATTSERPGLVRVNSYIRSLENPRWKQIKSYASPKGVIFTPHGLLGVVTFEKKKNVTQGKTEYTDFRKWRVMRSKKAYVPTGKTVHVRKPKARWVDAEVDDPLHSTHAALFCVASVAAVDREEGAQLHVTFNPFFARQGYILQNTIIQGV